VQDSLFTQTEDAVEEKRIRIERGGRRECGGTERKKEGRVEEESMMRKEGEEGQSTDSEAKF
jgi:hypothetical protein